MVFVASRQGCARHPRREERGRGRIIENLDEVVTQSLSVILHEFAEGLR